MMRRHDDLNLWSGLGVVESPSLSLARPNDGVVDKAGILVAHMPSEFPWRK